MSYFEDNFGSRVGKWTAMVPPLKSRKMELHLFREDHPGASAFYDDKLGVQKAVTMEVVKFSLVQCPEGDFAPGAPAIESAGSMLEGNEVLQFMQAIVNEAAKLGIYAAGTKDITKELAATKNHLEDMRQCVFGDKLKPMGHRA